MVTIPDFLLRKNHRTATEINLRIRLWMLRILMKLGGHRQFLGHHGFDDDNIAQAVGLGHWIDTEKDISHRQLLSELRHQHRDAEQRHTRAALPASLSGNLNRLSKLVGLDETERSILEFVICLHDEKRLEAASDQLGSLSSSRMYGVLATILGLPESDVRRAMRPRGPLLQSGLITVKKGFSGDLHDKLSLLSREFADAMFVPRSNPLDLLRGVVGKADKGHLKLPDYAHVQPMLGNALHYLRHALAAGSGGVNLLIYGKPGTGKSELVRTLGKALRTEVFEVAHEDEDGDPIDGEERLKSFRVAQCFLAKRKALMVFDEIEDIFNDYSDGSAAHQRKAWINRMLEANPVPAVWLSNDIRSMDPAFIRRFDMVFELPVPPRHQRAKILHSHCKGLLDAGQIARIAELEHLAPAIVTRASHVVRAICDDIGKENTASAMQRLIDNTLLAQQLPVLSGGTAGRLPEVYDPAFIHADANLTDVAAGLCASRSGRLCLYGPPGTGKTAYGRWLAQLLDMPLLVKRASDLMSPYVGENEQNIAAAFRQAEQQGALLLIDEVDSFLQDRRKAQRSWETSMVNEMLTCMESFPGVFIASTNLMDGLDQAALRRFDLKVKFGYLRHEQAWELLGRHCAQLGLPPPSPTLQASMRKLDRLTPGDYAAVARQHRFRPLATPAMLVAALQAECAVKEGTNRPIGFM